MTNSKVDNAIVDAPSCLEDFAANVEAADFSKGWTDENAAPLSAYYVAARKSQDNKKILSYLSIATGLSTVACRGKLVSLKVYDTTTENDATKKVAAPKRVMKQDTVNNIRAALECATSQPIATDALDSLTKANAAALNVLLDSLISLSDRMAADASKGAEA